MKKLTLLLVLWSITFALNAQEAYEKHLFVSAKGDSLPYRLLKPEVMVPGEKYPLVLFLHGAGERGTDNEKQLTHGGQMFLNPVNRENYPAYVLFPQCPPNGYWAYRERPSSFMPNEMPTHQETSLIKAVKELLDTYAKLPNADKSRIYVIGLSMGGMATFDIIVRYPDTFAAAIPICGTVNPARLSGVKDTYVRIFHGDLDNVVTVEGSRQPYKALKAAGAKVEYIEFPGVTHGSWNPAFNYPDFMQWLFSKQKK